VKFDQLAKHEAKWNFHHLCQYKTSSNNAFLDKFMSSVDIVIHCGGDLSTDWEEVSAQLQAISKTNKGATDEEIEMMKQRPETST